MISLLPNINNINTTQKIENTKQEKTSIEKIIVDKTENKDSTVNIVPRKKGFTDTIKLFKDPIDSAVSIYGGVAGQSKIVASFGNALDISARTGVIGSVIGNNLVKLSDSFAASNTFSEVTQRNVLAGVAKVVKKTSNPELAQNIARLGSEKYQANIVSNVAKATNAKLGKTAAGAVTTVGKALSSGVGSKAVKVAPKVITTLSRGARIASVVGKVSPTIGFVSGVVSTGFAVNDAAKAKSWQGKTIHSTRAVVNIVGASSSFVPGIGAVVGIGSAGIDIGLGLLGKKFK